MITVMISSTVSDLLEDRDAIVKVFEPFSFIQTVGAAPIKGLSYTRSPYTATIEMAASCDLFLLLLGGRYGFGVKDGKSATEVEFDAAYNADPTKILVFQKEGVKVAPKQRKFIKSVNNYYNGYCITTYTYIQELQKLIVNSFELWIKERASIGHKLNYFDHFVRLAIQRSPSPGAQVLYSVQAEFIELQYLVFDRNYFIHFDKI
jgi:Domain of unknown function (DUF4062)